MSVSTAALPMPRSTALIRFYYSMISARHGDVRHRDSIGNAGVIGRGDVLWMTSGSAGARFLLVSGKPLGEQIAWYGPIVMNTEEEIRLAYDELASGEFVKKK